VTTDAANSSPSWSPDGSRLVFASTRTPISKLYTVGADGSGEAPIGGGGVDGANPAWSPDGQKIAFTRGAGYYDHIFIMRPDGSQLVQLGNTPDGEDDPSWSPDGSKIAYMQSTFIIDIHVIGLDGRPIPVTGETGSSYLPAWSPDGTKIAFQTDACTASGCGDSVAIMNADGSNRLPVTPGKRFNGQPEWGPVPSPLPSAHPQSLKPPRCKLRGKVERRFRHAGKFRLTVSCDQSAEVRLKGAVSFTTRRISLKPKTVSVAATKPMTVVLRLSRAALRRVVRALKHHRKVAASFNASASGPAGVTTSTARLGRLR
jgi:hypothetical protein